MKGKGFEISADSKPFVIAELSSNHNGDINKALELIEKANEAGTGDKLVKDKPLPKEDTKAKKDQKKQYPHQHKNIQD